MFKIKIRLDNNNDLENVFKPKQPTKRDLFG